MWYEAAQIRRVGGEIAFAFYERSRWSQGQQAAGNSSVEGCTIRWYQLSLGDRIVDSHNPSPAQASPVKGGLLVEPCSGWRFDAHGRWLFGGSTPLDRIPVHIVVGTVVVNVRHNRWWTLSPPY